MNTKAMRATDFKGGRVPNVQIGNKPYGFVPKLEKKLSILPAKPRNFLLEVLLTGSFLEAVHQMLQQILIDLIPKVLVGGTLRAKNSAILPNQAGVTKMHNTPDTDKPSLWKLIGKLVRGEAAFNKEVGIDETIAEVLEYVAVYFLPTLAAVSFIGRLIGRTVGTNYEFLGQPMHLYEKNLGKLGKVGRVRDKFINIDEKTLAKIGLGKTMLFATVTTFCSAISFATPSIRTFVTNWACNINNYSELLGFENNLPEDQNFDPLKNAANIIQKSLSIAFLSIPAFVGLTWILNKNLNEPFLQKFFRRTARHFDLDSPFGLSRSFVAPTIMSVAFGYFFGSRGDSERIETWNRSVLYAAPAVIFYKQLVVNVLTFFASLPFGITKDLPKLFSTIRQQIKGGERDPLNWHLISDFKKNEAKYKGLITESPSIKSLSESRKKTFYGLLSVIKNSPYVLAPLVGFLVNWHNFLKIFEQHQEGQVQGRSTFAFNGLTSVSA
jgi:hypothetical protein